MNWQVDGGWTFALLPIRCIDGSWAWLRKVYWADVNHGIFYSPYTTTRFYSTTKGWQALDRAALKGAPDAR